MFDFTKEGLALSEVLDHKYDLKHNITAQCPEFTTGIRLPEIITSHGYITKIPIINQFVLYKMTATRKDTRFSGMHPHHLTKRNILNVFRKISDPIAIVKADDGNLFILTDELDRFGYPIGVAVTYNRVRNENIVCSCYGRRNFVSFLSYKVINQQVIMINKEKLFSLINTVYNKKIEDEVCTESNLVSARRCMRMALQVQQMPQRMPRTLDTIRRHVEIEKQILQKEQERLLEERRRRVTVDM